MPELLSEKIAGQHEKFILYGEMGTSKTFTAGTMPGIIYSIAFGGKNEFKTYLSPDFRNKHPEKEGKIYIDYVKEQRGKRGMFLHADAYDMACDLVEAAIEKEKAGDFTFDSVVIDAATGLREVAMNKAMEFMYGRAHDKSKTAMAALKDQNMTFPADVDWGGQMNLVWKFVSWLYDLEKHVCLISHEWTTKKRNRGTGEVEILTRQPLFTGENRKRIINMFDNVWHMEAEPAKRGIVGVAQTIRDERILARTRIGGVLPMYVKDPNLADCITKLQEGAK